MKCAKFPEQNLVIAENQPEFMPIPAFYKDGMVNFCWELTDDEIAKLMITKRIWHTCYTGGLMLQPVILQVNKPEMN